MGMDENAGLYTQKLTYNKTMGPYQCLSKPGGYGLANTQYTRRDTHAALRRSYVAKRYFAAYRPTFWQHSTA